MIGQTVQHYRILDQLGAGGMGQVYLAEDQKLERKVALKVLPQELADRGGEFLERFEREAKAVATLNHPNIVTVYSVEQADDLHFLTMELVEGMTLEASIPEDGFPAEQFFEIAIALADALAAAHRRGIIHRDIKPSNVMITDDGIVKVLDFGLAKLSEPSGEGGDDMATLTAPITEFGRVLGTVPYMSPEQVKGLDVDHRSDLFSLGIVLYEMATGERPFQGETSADLISSILRDSPPEIGALKGDAPAYLATILDDCLEKDREQRIDSAATLKARLVSARDETASDTARVAAPAEEKRERLRLPSRAWIAAAALVIVAAGLAFRSGRPSAELATERRIESIAVLPLENLTGDPEQEYFADGITETLINELAHLQALRVISRTSAMRYKKSDKSLKEIASELEVDALVEGSVMRSGDRVGITARLVDGVTDRFLWSNSYERDLRDVLTLRKEMAKAIAEEIRIAVSPEEAQRLEEVEEVDPVAYDSYLKGRFYWNNRFTPEGLRLAIARFEEAIAAQDDHALSWAGLADCYVGLEVLRALPASEAMPKAKAAAERALEIDETLAEAHTSISLVLWNYERRWQEAESEALRAIELRPSYAMAHQWLGTMRAMRGDHDQAMAAIHKAQELDPLSLLIHRDIGFILYLGHRYEEAAKQLAKTLELDPTYVWARELLAQVELARGRIGEASAELEAISKSSGLTPSGRALRAYASALAGQDAAARDELEELLTLVEEGRLPAGLIALVHRGLGQDKEAFDWLDRAYEEGDSYLVLLRQDPAWDPVRKTPRFQDLLRRLSLPRRR